MKSYKCLKKQEFSNNEFKLVPIRFKDKIKIMNWRNEQLYHLRQDEILTIEDQKNYFINVVKPLFNKEKPEQILFSFLENNKCIGYGGLVHINWIDKNAEISFIMATEIEKEHFKSHWRTFLSLLEILAFEELKLHKIFTYAFDTRPQLFEILVECKYTKESDLKEHVLINGVFENVLIHAKFNTFN